MKQEIKDVKKVLDDEIEGKVVNTLLEDDIREDVSKEELVKSKEIKVKRIPATSVFRTGFVLGQLTMIMVFLIYLMITRLF